VIIVLVMVIVLVIVYPNSSMPTDAHHYCRKVDEVYGNGIRIGISP
jgi:hypothetical protein